jgi:competence protein ComEC
MLSACPAVNVGTSSKNSVNSSQLQENCRQEAGRMTHPDTASLPASIPVTPPRRYRPLVPVMMAFCIAILAAEQSTAHLLWGIGIVVMLAGVCVGLALRYTSARGLLLSAACTLVLGYGYTLWTAIYLPADDVSHYLDSTPVTLEARVLRLAKAGKAKASLDLSARALSNETTVVPVSGRVRVTAYDFEPAVETGDIVRIHRLRLRRPHGFRNPGAFDYGRYLARRGIYATGSLSKGERLEVVQRGSSGYLAHLSAFRAGLAAHIERMMTEPAGAITQEMVLGIRGGLSPEVREAFSASGTAHLMSVSGLHVGFVYAAVFIVLKHGLIQLRFRLLGRFSGGPRPSKLAAAGGLLAVLGYACLVGSNLPTIRATLMIATYVIAYLLDRDGDPWHTTALAALLMLIVHPLSLFDIGFQLSFAGVLAILYAQRLLHPPDTVAVAEPESVGLTSRAKTKLWDAVLISTFASLGTAPLIAAVFQRLPLIAPLANIVVVPLASIAVPLALLASFLAETIQPLGDPLLFLAGMVVTGMYALIAMFAAIPYAAPRVGMVGLPVTLLAYSTLALMPYSRASRAARWGAVTGAILIGAWLAWPWMVAEGRGQLEVTFLDVGHGDASFIRFPQGSTMLIDGGGSYRDDFDVGERVVAPFLWYRGVRRVDYVVATHSHPDHAKGLGVILRDFRVRQFWDNGTRHSAPWYDTLRQAATDQHRYRDVVSDGPTTATVDGVHLELLHPTTTFQPQMKRRGSAADAGENNRSLVIKLTYGTVSVLFTGDIEQEAEGFLLQSGHGLHATILKVPHHGSRTSSSDAFVRAVHPSVAVFSVQRDGRFGHPHAVVLDRYTTLGAHIFRTDAHGAITVRTDGQSVWVEPYVGRSLALSAPTARHLAETLTRPAAGPR